MLQEIAPGSKINVKVVKRPTSAAATKTIVQLLSRDRSVRRDNERLRKARAKHLREQARGGRTWRVRVVKQRPVEGKVGETGTLTVNLDVLTALKSVERFLEVSKA